MERNCRNCKYYCNKKCLHKNMIQSINIFDGIEYVENGILNEVLEEQLNTKNIIKLVLESLSNNEIMKKKYCYDKNTEYAKALKGMDTDIEDIHTDIINEVDEAISGSIQNYFSGISKENFIPGDPDNFCCNNWE